VVDTVAAGELAVDAALVDWRLRCVMDTVAAGELAVGAALVDLEAALCGGHSGSR
jgi:hypothetical protein